MRKVIKRMGAILVLLTAGVVLCFTGMISKAETTATVYEGIYIEDVSLGGMSKENIMETIESYVDEILNRSITLQTEDGKEIITSLKNVGGTWTNPEIIDEIFMYGRQGNLIERYKSIQDIKKTNIKYMLTFSVDENIAKKFIETNFLKYEVESVNAIYERKDGVVVITPEFLGKKLNEEVTFLELKEYVEKNWKNEIYQTNIYFDFIEAKGTEEEFSKMVDVLGSFTTSYRTSSTNRSGNVVNGCSKIDGTFLYPGEVVSAYEMCHPFTYENGYFDAGAYLNGMVVPSIGGGICQISTTLYNAALRAELEILERQPHSMIVSYVKLAEDSAISGTYKDLKFSNNLEHPIYIEGITTEDKHLTFTIYGIEERPENREISFLSKKTSENVPTTERIVQDPEFAVGYVKTQGVHIGYTAELWKLVLIDGIETDRIFVNESKYIPSARTVIVGIGGASPEIAAAISAAASTGSIEEVRATVAAILATPAP